MTNQPKLKSASEILNENIYWIFASLQDEAKFIEAMHTFAEQAIREFAERVKGKCNESFYDCDVPDEEFDLLRDQLLTEIKNQK